MYIVKKTGCMVFGVAGRKSPNDVLPVMRMGFYYHILNIYDTNWRGWTCSKVYLMCGGDEIHSFQSLASQGTRELCRQAAGQPKVAQGSALAI